MKSSGKGYKPILILLITLFVIIGLGIYKNSIETESFRDTMFESRGQREPFFNTGNPSENAEGASNNNTCLISGLQSDLNHITSNLSGAFI